MTRAAVAIVGASIVAVTLNQGFYDYFRKEAGYGRWKAGFVTGAWLGVAQILFLLAVGGLDDVIEDRTTVDKAAQEAAIHWVLWPGPNVYQAGAPPYDRQVVAAQRLVGGG